MKLTLNEKQSIQDLQRQRTTRITLNEALSNAQTWREKMERLGLVKMPEVVHKPSQVIQQPRTEPKPTWHQKYGAKRSAKRSAEKLNFRKRYHDKILKALELSAWTRNSIVAAAINVNPLMSVAIANDLVREGKVVSKRYHSSTWFALRERSDEPLPQDREFIIKRAAQSKKNKLEARERLKASKAKTTRLIRSLPGGIQWEGEASEAWRTPQ